MWSQDALWCSRAGVHSCWNQPRKRELDFSSGRPSAALTFALFELPHFIMERKMMLTIKAQAEKQTLRDLDRASEARSRRVDQNALAFKPGLR